jgi:hypothetical protein
MNKKCACPEESVGGNLFRMAIPEIATSLPTPPARQALLAMTDYHISLSFSVLILQLIFLMYPRLRFSSLTIRFSFYLVEILSNFNVNFNGILLLYIVGFLPLSLKNTTI